MKFLEEVKRAIKVPLRFHWSFVILPLLFIYLSGFINGLIFCAILTASILFHEYAHVWMAQRQGVYTSKVVLMGFGAAAMVNQDDLIRSHIKELKIAAAGPVASAVLFLLFLALFLIMGLFKAYTVVPILCNLIIFAGVMNLLLAVFNILPLYPSDGGRILNAILSMYMSGVKAIKISALITYILASLGSLCAFIFGEWWLGSVLIFLIIFAKIQKDQALRGMENI